MSGHSKWATIKRAKGAKDAKRGQLFSKLSKKLTLAAKAGGSADPKLNYQLARELDTARKEGLPADNIDRAIKKAFSNDGAQLLEGLYEGYGPYGTAFLVEVATDSKNRAASQIKHIFSKHGGSMGAQGSVAWQFETKGQILVERSSDSETIILSAIEMGALDVVDSDEGLEIYTNPQDLEKIKVEIAKLSADIASAEIIKASSQLVKLEPDQKLKVEQLYNDLTDYDDVIGVYTNAEI